MDTVFVPSIRKPVLLVTLEACASNHLIPLYEKIKADVSADYYVLFAIRGESTVELLEAKPEGKGRFFEGKAS